MTHQIDLRGDDRYLLLTYRNEIRKIPGLTRDDEQRLGRQLSSLQREVSELEKRLDDDRDTGHLSARRRNAEKRLKQRRGKLEEVRNEMIRGSLHLVLHLIDRYKDLGVSTLDLIQEGNVALFRAVERFDWQRGVRFQTYANYWIVQAFLNAVYSLSRTVRIPAYIQKRMKKIHDACLRTGQTHPDPSKLARETKLSGQQIENTLRNNRRCVSIDQESEIQGGGIAQEAMVNTATIIDTLAANEVSLHARIEQSLAVLSERERCVLRLRYGVGADRSHTLAEIGTSLGISLERVRQIQNNALERLRGPTCRKLLNHFQH